MGVRVVHSIDDLTRDLRTMTAKAPVELRGVVRRNAEDGNRIAKAFASQQHTMNSSIDEPYARSFTAERLGPMAWVYGPTDDGIKHGGQQAVGYENGSRNQKPHMNLARSVDIIGPKFAEDVLDAAVDLFWPGA